MMVPAIVVVIVGGIVFGQQPFSFATRDGGLIHALTYGEGARGVVLAHGGRFNKESWAKQAMELASAGFRVLALDFRGYGESRGPGQTDPLSAPLQLDVLADARYLRQQGAKSVSIVGASMGAARRLAHLSKRIRAK
jgi:pimeloyl-ACP methyl ester carboxylesterase